MRGLPSTASEEATMQQTNAISYQVPFTSDSNLAKGLYVLAALGGASPHRFQVDTGSVGILVPRRNLGPDYQDFDPSQDIKFGYVSSGAVYWGQWVKVPVVLGVPPTWDGTDDNYPVAQIEVFAVDRPTEFCGGVLGIGFAIGGLADGGPARNPLLHLTYHSATLSPGYIVSSQAINAGLTPLDTAGFAFGSLDRNASGEDWMQPMGSLGLPDGFSVDLPVLMDTGIDEMLLWLHADDRPPTLANYSELPAGIEVSISVPPADQVGEPVLQYTFVTGDTSQPMAPSQVDWRDGTGINTGRNVLAGADYLYDSAGGRIGFRVPRAQSAPAGVAS
jgi:hypothetical protein